MALQINISTKTFTLGAGESLTFAFRFHNKAKVPESLTGRAFVMTIYDDLKSWGYYDGVVIDGSNPMILWRLDGKVSEDLRGKELLLEVSERLDNGREVIWSGKINVTKTAPTIGDYDSAPINRYLSIITRENDPETIDFPAFSNEITLFSAISAVLPAFTTQPSVSGSSTVGGTLTATDGVATAPISARQWLLNSTTIAGATGLTYVTAAAGQYTFRATSTNATGSTNATSAAFAVSAATVTPPAPSFTTQPSISPTGGNVGATFTANDGAVSAGSITGRRWLLDGTQIGTSTTVNPVVAGSLTLEVTAVGTNGSTIKATSSAVTVSAVAAPAPSLAFTTDSSKRMVAGSGFQLPNKDGSIGSGFTQYGQYATYPAGLDWEVPTNGTIEVLYANFMVHEASSVVNEDMIMTSDATIRALWIYYTDKAGIAQKAKATLSDGGILRAATSNGGVSGIFTLPTAMAKNTSYTIGLGIQCVDGARMPNGGGLSFTGDLAKKHAVDNFDTVLANKGNLVFTGSNSVSTATGSWSGGYIHPFAVLATGNDGRPSLFGYGDSHMFGKGTSYTNIAAQRRMGLVEHAMFDSATTGYSIPVANMSIAGSGSTTNDSEIRKNTRAAWDAVIARNGGYVPFTHYITNEGTNSLKGTTAAQIDMINARNNWWKAWQNKPVIQLTMIQKGTSTDGFRTLANESIQAGDANNGVRFNYNDALMNGEVSSVSYAVNVAKGIEYDATTNRDKFAIRPFTAQLTRATVAGAASLYLNAAPLIGEALALDPLSGSAMSRIVTAVTDQGNGEWFVATETGSSAGTYPAKDIGTLVGAHLTADGQTGVVGLHVSYQGHIAMIPQYTALKNELKKFNGGAWVQTTPTTTPAQSLRAVGTGGRNATGTRTFASTTKWRNRSTSFVRSATSFVEFRYPNWYVDDAGVTQYVTYPAGTTIKCQFDVYSSGTTTNAAGDKTATGTVNGAGGNVGATIVGGSGEPWITARLNASDVGLTTFAAGAAVCCLLEADAAAVGVAFALTDSTGSGSTSTPGENFYFGGTTSIGTYGALTGMGGTSGVYALRPYAVLGDGSASAVIAIGDSNTAGKGAGRPASDGNVTTAGMAAYGLYQSGKAYTVFGKNGDRASFWDAAPANDVRWSTLAWFDGALLNLGTNDLSGAASATDTVPSTTAIASARSLRIKIKSALGGSKKVAQAMILPRVSSSAGFTTTAAQTVTTGYKNSDAGRPAYDASLVADLNASGRALDLIFDPRSLVNDPTETDKWRVDGVTTHYFEFDGTHLTANGAGAASVAYKNAATDLTPA